MAKTPEEKLRNYIKRKIDILKKNSSLLNLRTMKSMIFES